jgi:non-canonical purine NTP pyrophosphatase (RdgB/HAM1 family)
MISKYDDRKAFASSWIGHIDEKGNIKFFQGKVEGIIVEPRGENGFGFDSIFRPMGSDKTFAEMTTEEKNQFSHRAKAFNLLKQYLES